MIAHHQTSVCDVAVLARGEPQSTVDLQTSAPKKGATVSHREQCGARLRRKLGHANLVLLWALCHMSALVSTNRLYFAIISFEKNILSWGARHLQTFSPHEVIF